MNVNLESNNYESDHGSTFSKNSENTNFEESADGDLAAKTNETIIIGVPIVLNNNSTLNAAAYVPLCDFIRIVQKEKIDFCLLNVTEKTEYINRFVKGKTSNVNFTPSFSGLDLQRFLLVYYSNADEYIKFNRKRGKEVDTESLIYVHHFAMKHHLSSQGGEELLDMIFKQVLPRYLPESVTHPSVPQYRSVFEAINKNLHIIFPVQVHKFQLPPNFFGIAFRHKDLKPAIGAKF